MLEDWGFFSKGSLEGQGVKEQIAGVLLLIGPCSSGFRSIFSIYNAGNCMVILQQKQMWKRGCKHPRIFVTRSSGNKHYDTRKGWSHCATRQSIQHNPDCQEFRGEAETKDFVYARWGRKLCLIRSGDSSCCLCLVPKSLKEGRHVSNTVLRELRSCIGRPFLPTLLQVANTVPQLNLGEIFLKTV